MKPLNVNKGIFKNPIILGKMILECITFVNGSSTEVNRRMILKTEINNNGKKYIYIIIGLRLCKTDPNRIKTLLHMNAIKSEKTDMLTKPFASVCSANPVIHL